MIVKNCINSIASAARMCNRISRGDGVAKDHERCVIRRFDARRTARRLYSKSNSHSYSNKRLTGRDGARRRPGGDQSIRRFWFENHDRGRMDLAMETKRTVSGLPLLRVHGHQGTSLHADVVSRKEEV